MLFSRGAVLGLRGVHPSAIIAQVSAVRHPILWERWGQRRMSGFNFPICRDSG